MIKLLCFVLEKFNIYLGYIVGYGFKDNNIFVFYVVFVVLYGEGVLVCLVNDCYEQFQSGIKCYLFDICY